MGQIEVVAIAALGSFSVAAAAYSFLASRPTGALPSAKTMRRLVVSEPNEDVEQIKVVVEQTEIPKPIHGQVLVRMEAVPVNPSDYNEWRQKKGGIGHEGCGVVVASGGGWLANRLVGRRVGVVLSKSGTVSEYLCCSALKEVFTLLVPSDLPLADCANWFVNPFTALSILDTAKTKHKTNALVHTAASSQLGQMLIKLAPSRGVTLVNVVRKKEHWSILKTMGASHVICTDDDDWMEQLKAHITNLEIFVAFDAVAGDMTGELMTCLPKNSFVYVYGVLAQEPVGAIDPVDLIYRRKQVRGFHVAKDWLSVGGPANMIHRINRGSRLVGAGLAPGGWATSQFVDCNMDTMHDTFCELWKNGFTGRKLRILFQ